MDRDHIERLCPLCEQRMIQTVETVPFVRGFLLAYQMGRKQMIGCCPCVRRAVLREVGRSALIGWFSLTAILVNPVLIVYGLVRAALVTPRVGRVVELLRRAGIPESRSDAAA